VARDVGSHLRVDVVDGTHQIWALGEAHELDARRRLSARVRLRDVEDDLEFAADLTEPPVLGETQGCRVVFRDPAPERGVAAPCGVLRQGRVQLASDSLPSMLGQDARHHVRAARDRGGPADAAAERLIAARCEEPRALLVAPDHVRELVLVVDVPFDPLHDRCPLLELRARRRRLEPDAHRTFAANTPPPPYSPVPDPT
jgi:hypothetical protein